MQELTKFTFLKAKYGIKAVPQIPIPTVVDQPADGCPALTRPPLSARWTPHHRAIRRSYWSSPRRHSFTSYGQCNESLYFRPVMTPFFSRVRCTVHQFSITVSFTQSTRLYWLINLILVVEQIGKLDPSILDAGQDKESNTLLHQIVASISAAYQLTEEAYRLKAPASGQRFNDNRLLVFLLEILKVFPQTEAVHFARNRSGKVPYEVASHSTIKSLALKSALAIASSERTTGSSETSTKLRRPLSLQTRPQPQITMHCQLRSLRSPPPSHKWVWTRRRGAADKAFCRRRRQEDEGDWENEGAYCSGPAFQFGAALSSNSTGGELNSCDFGSCSSREDCLRTGVDTPLPPPARSSGWGREEDPEARELLVRLVCGQHSLSPAPTLHSAGGCGGRAVRRSREWGARERLAPASRAAGTRQARGALPDAPPRRAPLSCCSHLYSGCVFSEHNILLCSNTIHIWNRTDAV